MKNINLTLILLSFFAQFNFAQPISQWRGENRDGIYNETNLLKVWPEGGPELLWFNDSLPKGYSSPAVDEDRIYVTGIIDTLDYLIALDTKGNVLWQTAYGNAFMNSFSDSRATPTIDGNNIYVSSGYCDIACINKETGKIIWQVDGYVKYEGKKGEWGYSESLLILGDKVFFTPAGDKTTMVALNKNTGEEIWHSKSLNDFTGYVSPIVINENGLEIILTVLAHNIVGINAKTGDILFHTNYVALGSEESSLINTNSPLYKNKEIYVTSGYNYLGAKFKLSDDLKELTLVWIDTVLDVHHGGVVLVDGYIYGSNWLNNAKGNWCCINWETGKVMYETEWQTKGSIISAEGLLYCYEEKRGNIALVQPTPEAFKIISEFPVPKGTGPHWSHLVINKGKLYVRHEDALMVYDISKK